MALQCQFGRWELKDYWIFKPEHVAFFAPAQKLSGSIVWTPIRNVTLQFGDRRGSASLPLLNILRRNHRSLYVWTEALPGMVFTPAQKLSGSIVWTPIRYVTLQFGDRRGTASLCYRNRTVITVLMCEQKPYAVWFSCMRKSYPVSCEQQPKSDIKRFHPSMQIY